MKERRVICAPLLSNALTLLAWQSLRLAVRIDACHDPIKETHSYLHNIVTNLFEKKLRKYFVNIEKSYTFAHAIADMAQLVEQRIRNAWVPGSSPGIGSRGENIISPFFLCGISTSVVYGLPKPGRRVRFPYPAPDFNITKKNYNQAHR